MPVKYLANQPAFNSFKAELRTKFQENFYSFHVCKYIHGNEECDECYRLGPDNVASQAWDQPSFFVLYINPDLCGEVLAYFRELIIDYPLHEDEDPNDPDGNSHIRNIFMCPYCGTKYAEQNL